MWPSLFSLTMLTGKWKYFKPVLCITVLALKSKACGITKSHGVIEKRFILFRISLKVTECRGSCRKHYFKYPVDDVPTVFFVDCFRPSSPLRICALSYAFTQALCFSCASVQRAHYGRLFVEYMKHSLFICNKTSRFARYGSMIWLWLWWQAWHWRFIKHACKYCRWIKIVVHSQSSSPVQFML